MVGVRSASSSPGSAAKVCNDARMPSIAFVGGNGTPNTSPGHRNLREVHQNGT